MPFVLDASVALAWHFRDEDSASAKAAARRSYSDPVVVPQHWPLEVASAALRGERRQRAEPEDVDRFIERLRTLDIRTDALAPDEVYSNVIPLARAHRLTVYDAAYLELAERLGLPLATLDAALTKAARSVGVQLVEEE
jgi:predicted nucleic acid-binding protein